MPSLSDSSQKKVAFFSFMIAVAICHFLLPAVATSQGAFGSNRLAAHSRSSVASDSICYATVRMNGVVSGQTIACVNRDAGILIDAQAFCAAIGGSYYPFYRNTGLTIQYGKFLSFAAVHFKQGFTAAIKCDMLPPAEEVNNTVMAPLAFLSRAIQGRVDFIKEENLLDIQAENPDKIGAAIPEAKNVAEKLMQEKYIVQQGAINSANPIEFFAAGYTPDCQGNNANFPYLVIQTPPAPGVPFVWTFPAIINMRPDEAFVIIGKTPPECVYYSYRSYLASRYYIEATPPQRKKVFASMGDTQNCLNIAEGRKNTQVFDRFIMIISTADSKIEQAIRQAARDAGIDDDDIYLDLIPGDVVRFGLDDKADLLTFLHRVSLFQDPQEEDQYLRHPDVEILRVTPGEPVTPDFIPRSALRPRGSGSTEFNLKDGLEQLRQAIIEKYAAAYDAVPVQAPVWGLEWGLEGLQAIEIGVNTLGEVRDTIYLLSESFVFNQDDFIAVFGVNHTKTHKATYCNVSCYGAEYFNGFGGIADQEYEGTASEYLPDSALADNYYVWKFARGPMDEHTFVVPPDLNKDFTGIDYGAEAKIGFRAYMEPATKVGPSPDEIILDQVIVFRPKQTTMKSQNTIMHPSQPGLTVFPNPFNSQTEIQLNSPDCCDVRVTVFNIRGQAVRELFSASNFSGLKNIIWMGTDTDERPVSSGVYLISLVRENHRIKKTEQVYIKVLFLQ